MVGPNFNWKWEKEFQTSLWSKLCERTLCIKLIELHSHKRPSVISVQALNTAHFQQMKSVFLPLYTSYWFFILTRRPSKSLLLLYLWLKFFSLLSVIVWKSVKHCAHAWPSWWTAASSVSEASSIWRTGKGPCFTPWCLRPRAEFEGKNLWCSLKADERSLCPTELFFSSSVIYTVCLYRKEEVHGGNEPNLKGI